MMKFFVAASVAALSLVGATAQAATSVYAGYDGSYDSTYFTIVTDQALTGVTFTGQQDGNPSVDTWNVGNVAAGSTTLYFTSIGAFQYDYDDYFGGAATYTFSADSLAPASFSPSTNASGSFLGFLGNNQSGNESDATVYGLVVQASAAPEPASWALMILGVGGMGAALRTRRRTVAA